MGERERLKLEYELVYLLRPPSTLLTNGKSMKISRDRIVSS